MIVVMDSGLLAMLGPGMTRRFQRNPSRSIAKSNRAMPDMTSTIEREYF
jgi:hypothetical protein